MNVCIWLRLTTMFWKYNFSVYRQRSSGRHLRTKQSFATLQLCTLLSVKLGKISSCAPNFADLMKASQHSGLTNMSSERSISGMVSIHLFVQNWFPIHPHIKDPSICLHNKEVSIPLRYKGARVFLKRWCHMILQKEVRFYRRLPCTVIIPSTTT